MLTLEDYDLVIVGGGMVGASLALSLSDTPLRIALIEAREPQAQDARLFALNVHSCQFLEHLQLWPQLVASASPIHQIHVSYQGHFGSVRLAREEVGLSELGHVIPAHLIEAALHRALASQQGQCGHPTIDVYCPATLQHFEQQAEHVALSIETAHGEKKLLAKLVIAADGTHSGIRTRLGLPVETVDYEQAALVTRTTLKRSHQQVAYERFCDEPNLRAGAIAMLPLPGMACATIWSGDRDTMTHLMSLSDQAFVCELQRVFGYRLGRLLAVGERFVYPLKMVKAKETLSGRVLLLGNAAHTLHPIAAQGFNLALYEVAALCQRLKWSSQQSRPLTPEDLAWVKQETSAQLEASLLLSHRIVALFSKPASFWDKMLSMVLPLGMIGFDQAKPLKRRFIERMTYT